MSQKKSIPPKEELEKRYTSYGATISQVAREYNVSNPVLRKWLKTYDIPLKDHKEASTQANNRKRVSPPSKETLEKLYSCKSIDQLEEIFLVGQQTIYHWLDSYGITRKTLSEATRDAKQRLWESMVPSKSEFIDEYSKTKNLKALETKFELSTTSIKKLVKTYNIETHKPWRSMAEINLFETLESVTDYKWYHSDKTIINPYELDIVCHEKKIAIEYCGLYWHSENTGQKTKNYHLNKIEKCKQKNYSLITVFESDPMDKVISIIKSKLGLNKKIYARDCNITLLNHFDAKSFNEQNHLHGHHNGSVNIGLLYKDDLVMVLSMGKARYNLSHQWECIRMTGKSDITVIGGASKLFKYFIKTYNPESIITYSDRRFGEGNVYLNCGFTKLEDTGPNYWYFSKTDTTKIFSRVTFQKHKLKSLSSYDQSLTEWEIMKSSGYDRIWDCGNCKYVWYK